MLLFSILLAQADLTVDAVLADDLASLQLRTQERVRNPKQVLVFAADRVRAPYPPAVEPNLYPFGLPQGGFEAVQIWGDGQKSWTWLSTEGARMARVPAHDWVRSEAVLRIPEQYGPYGLRGRQVTLGGGWYPYLSTENEAPLQGRCEVRVSVPAGLGVLLGERWFPAAPVRRTVQAWGPGAQIPLLVRPTAQVRPLAQGRAALLHQRMDSVALGEMDQTVTEALAVLESQGLRAPKIEAPIWLAEAPLRQHLAQVTEGPVLVSDRAFRVTPVERLLRFHRFPIQRELFTRWAWGALGHVTPDERWVVADAIAGWLLELLIQKRYGRAENAFDLLQLWSFIPSVDALLYAPQLPFVEAFFRAVREDDPLRPDLVAYPSRHPRGRILHEKLRDLGLSPGPVWRQVLAGAQPKVALATLLATETETFWQTWLGPYPELQYRLGPIQTEADRVTVVVERVGATVSEPVVVRLVGDEERRIVASATTAAVRTITATVSNLSLVELDPDGRLAETPSVEVPQPRYDNRSSPRWRVLLNNFNVLYSPTAGNVDTALDLGFSRVRDVRWRFAARAGYGPDSIGASGRASYYFGSAVTPDRLSQWLGAEAAFEQLRAGFGGQTEAAFASRLALFAGYDNRQTLHLPEAGQGWRASLSWSRTFGEEKNDAVAATLRGLAAWRVDALHQLSLRGSLGGYVYGTPQDPLLFGIGGRGALRGYVVDQELRRLRGLVSGEWVHPLLPELNENVFQLWWVTRLEGAFYADVAMLSDDLEGLGQRALRADLGYGFRIYLDYFGVRPGVMAIDIALPLLDLEGRPKLGPPAVYIDFGQSFLSF